MWERVRITSKGEKTFSFIFVMTIIETFVTKYSKEEKKTKQNKKEGWLPTCHRRGETERWAPKIMHVCC